MNFKSTVFAGILLAVTMATARRVSLDEKTMQAAGEADEPFEAMREAASLVKKIMRAANEADEPGEAKRAKRAKSLQNRFTSGHILSKEVAWSINPATMPTNAAGGVVTM